MINVYIKAEVGYTAAISSDRWNRDSIPQCHKYTKPHHNLGTSLQHKKCDFCQFHYIKQSLNRGAIYTGTYLMQVSTRLEEKMEWKFYNSCTANRKW